MNLAACKKLHGELVAKVKAMRHRHVSQRLAIWNDIMGLEREIEILTTLEEYHASHQ